VGGHRTAQQCEPHDVRVEPSHFGHHADIALLAPPPPRTVASDGFERVRRSELDRSLVVLATAVAIGAALRFATLGLQSLDEDETITVWLMHMPLGRMLTTLPHTESTPPLYYVLAWLWTHVTGTGAVGIRSLSALIGVATIPVAYAATVQLSNEFAGRIAAVLATLSPALVWYSQEARAYALLVLLSTASLLVFGRALTALNQDDGTSKGRFVVRRRLAWWALIASLGLTTHYFAAFLIAPQCVLLLVAAWRRRRGDVIVAGAGVAAVGLALLPLALHQQASGGSHWIGLIPLSDRLYDVPPQLLLGEGRPFYRYFAIAVGAAAILPLLLMFIRGAGKSRRSAVFVTVVGVCGVALPALVDLAGPKILIDRNTLGAGAVLLIGCAIGMGQRPRRFGLGALAVVAGLWLWTTVLVLTNPLLQREDWRDAAKALGPATVPRAIVYAPATKNPPPAPPLVPFQAIYLPSMLTMPDRGAAVREIDELNVRDDLSDTAPPPNPVSPGPGWRLMGRAGERTFTLFRFRSATPVHVLPANLIGAGLLENRDANETRVALQDPQAHRLPALNQRRVWRAAPRAPPSHARASDSPAA
jgi:4-amino-4-deoxy-L-arabinose transferase-like glycosyltransferase